ncbi:MAG: hypothetical protein HRU43_05430, partial [Simkaniaceae bacterium]|nr:hypothetical protein [Simkaniaceae bacterium]
MENLMSGIEHLKHVDAPVIAKPELPEAQKLINKSFGIIEASALKDGTKVLNTDYSAWTLAQKVNNGSTGWAVFTMIGDLFKRAFNNTIGQLTGGFNTLVGDAKSMQELIKNPVKATEAVKYLAELNLDNNVRLDLSQYRQNRLENATGTGDEASVSLAKAQSLEVSYGLAMQDIGKALGNKSPKELIDRFEGHQQSLEQLETAIREVSMLADSFDAQRQVVAALTYNIAQQAGIIDENGGVKDQARLDFLTDQMQSLWVKSAPSDKDTPIAVTKFADSIAEEFKPADTTSFDALKTTVSDMALRFADSQITHKGAGKVDEKGAEISHEDQIDSLAAKTEVQIWDALRANSTFTSKLSGQTSELMKMHTDLHDASEVIEKVSSEVQGRFEAISTLASGELSVGTLFSKQLHSLTGGKGETSMPHEMFGVLRELDKDS